MSYTDKKVSIMKDQSIAGCPVETAVNIIGGKWKILIIARLAHIGKQRFGKLNRSIPDVSERVLTRQLRELEKDGLIYRQVFAEVPPRVEYSLSKKGETLIPILNLLAEWGKKQQSLIINNINKNDTDHLSTRHVL